MAASHTASILGLGLLLLTSAWAFDEPLPKEIEPGPPPSDAIVLFDGKDLSHWVADNGKTPDCKLEGNAMACTSGVGNIFSREKFRSAQIHLEFNVPYMPDQKDQMRGNSGVYIQSRYEIQILDSYKSPTYPKGLCGALYGQAPPLVIASRPPAQWQTYDIVFHAPKCAADGTLASKGTVTVLQNGVLVQDHVTIENTGKGCAADHLGEPAPLMLQDHGGPNMPITTMRFRNIWVRPLD